MTTNFGHIPLSEVISDLWGARMDLKTCERLLSSDPRLQERIDSNKRQIEVIEQELRDRGVEVPREVA